LSRLPLAPLSAQKATTTVRPDVAVAVAAGADGQVIDDAADGDVGQRRRGHRALAVVLDAPSAS
jgi:hypothetical protein